MVEWMKMLLTEAGLEGWAEAKLVNQLLSKVHGLMEEFGAGSHKQMNIENAVGNDVLIETSFWLFAFHLLPPFFLFSLDFFRVSIVDVSSQIRGVPSYSTPVFRQVSFEGKIPLGHRKIERIRETGKALIEKLV